MFWVYAMYRSIGTYRTGSGSWRLLVIVSWWPYATLADVMHSYMSLFLPLAPVVVHDALLVVYAAGVVLMAIGGPISFYGHAPAFIALVFSLGVALAGLLAWWLWLDRVYRVAELPTILVLPM